MTFNRRSMKWLPNISLALALVVLSALWIGKATGFISANDGLNLVQSTSFSACIEKKGVSNDF